MPACNPMNITPLVPTKIDAGWKFQRRKPSSAPGEREAQHRTYGCPTVAVRPMIRPIVTAAIVPIPR